MWHGDVLQSNPLPYVRQKFQDNLWYVDGNDVSAFLIILHMLLDSVNYIYNIDSIIWYVKRFIFIMKNDYVFKW